MTTLTLSPAGLRLKVAAGTALRDVLFEQGVEFPCGGHGRCKGCRVRILKGRLEASVEEAKVLTAAELAGGWRLACRHLVEGDLELELAQWEMPVLSDHSTFTFVPRAGLGVAVDLGTTTIAAQLLDLQTGNVLAAETALNAQARYGDDNAGYLLEQFDGFTRHYDRLAYIATPAPASVRWEKAAKKIAAERDWKFERLPGDLGWLRRLVDGEWSGEEFLTLRPGERVALTHDERLIGAEPA